jgi:hypothetical protein
VERAGVRGNARILLIANIIRGFSTVKSSWHWTGRRLYRGLLIRQSFRVATAFLRLPSWSHCSTTLWFVGNHVKSPVNTGF